jgi:hypothetical protein
MTFNLATAFSQIEGKKGRPSAGPIDKVLGTLKDLAVRSGVQPLATGVLQPGLPAAGGARPGMAAGPAATEWRSPFTSLAGLAQRMQQEAARQDSDRQLLLAQQEASQHLGNLAGAAAGPGLRVQVVGTQPAQW